MQSSGTVHLSHVISSRIKPNSKKLFLKMNTSNQAPDSEEQNRDLLREEYYRTVIGPRRQAYYLSVFKKFDQQGRAGISWNWSAFLVPTYWCFYRKMGGVAGAYFLLAYFILPFYILPTALWLFATEYLAYLYLALIRFLAGIFANALYHRHCHHLIKKIQKQPDSLTQEKEKTKLAALGGVNRSVPYIGCFLIMVAIDISSRTYQRTILNGNIRGVFYRVEETFCNDYTQKNTSSSKLSDLNLEKLNIRNVKNIQINEKKRLVQVTISPVAIETLLGFSIKPKISPELSILIPKDVSQPWQCYSSNLPEKYLPSSCRNTRLACTSTGHEGYFPLCLRKILNKESTSSPECP